MVFSNGVTSMINGRSAWQCGYSGCQELRAIKLNGELHRFCEHHRQRQNQHQRDSVERQRRRERRRASCRHVRIDSTDEELALMELDHLFDATHELSSTEVIVAEWRSIFVESENASQPLAPLEELELLPIDDLDDFLDFLSNTSDL